MKSAQLSPGGKRSGRRACGKCPPSSKRKMRIRSSTLLPYLAGAGIGIGITSTNTSITITDPDTGHQWWARGTRMGPTSLVFELGNIVGGFFFDIAVGGRLRPQPTRIYYAKIDGLQ